MNIYRINDAIQDLENRLSMAEKPLKQKNVSYERSNVASGQEIQFHFSASGTVNAELSFTLSATQSGIAYVSVTAGSLTVKDYKIALAAGSSVKKKLLFDADGNDSVIKILSNEAEYSFSDVELTLKGVEMKKIADTDLITATETSDGLRICYVSEKQLRVINSYYEELFSMPYDKKCDLNIISENNSDQKEWIVAYTNENGFLTLDAHEFGSTHTTDIVADDFSLSHLFNCCKTTLFFIKENKVFCSLCQLSEGQITTNTPLEIKIPLGTVPIGLFSVRKDLDTTLLFIQVIGGTYALTVTSDGNTLSLGTLSPLPFQKIESAFASSTQIAVYHRDRNNIIIKSILAPTQPFTLSSSEKFRNADAFSQYNTHNALILSDGQIIPLSLN